MVFLPLGQAMPSPIRYGQGSSTLLQRVSNTLLTASPNQSVVTPNTLYLGQHRRAFTRRVAPPALFIGINPLTRYMDVNYQECGRG